MSNSFYCLSQNLSFASKGLLLDPKCPGDFPIRCISGDCVNRYQKCLSLDFLTSPALQQPPVWTFNKGLNSTTIETCQVMCADGSCRDRQENCPMVPACTGPLKPFRCMSGFCAQSKDACIALFGAASEQESAGKPSAVCQAETNSTAVLFRCEDGTCRPGTWDNSTQTA